MGLADFVTRRLADKIDFTATYVNTLTSTEPNSSRLPMVLENDRLVFQACVKLCGQPDLSKIRLAIIRNTKHLEEIYLSPAALAVSNRPECLEIMGECRPVPFETSGQLRLFDPAHGGRLLN